MRLGLILVSPAQINVSLSSDHWRPQSHLSIFRVNNEPTHDLDLQQKAGDTWKGMIARTGDGTTALVYNIIQDLKSRNLQSIIFDRSN